MEERQERMERVMQMLGVTPEYPYTFNVNDGTLNRVRIGLIGADYGIQIVDNAGNSILLANGTIVANAIKTGTLDCSLLTVTNLNAGSITAGTLSASYIQGGTLNCSLMTVQNLNAGSITVGTFSSPNDRFTDESLNGVKISQGTIYGNRIVANSINADRIQAGTITADRITAKTITADRIMDYSLGTGQLISNGVHGDRIQDLTITNAKIGSLSADKMTAGTIYVGYAGRPVAMYIAHGSSGDAKFWFEGGSRMWSDGSNRIGINSIGSPMTIYVDSYQILTLFSSGSQVLIGTDSNKVGCYVWGNFNVGAGNSRFGGNIITEGQVEHNNTDRIYIGGRKLEMSQNLTVASPTYIGSGVISNGAGQFSWWNGKSAVLPTSEGYRALYCLESPEIWFMDFCDAQKQLDPLFVEVTEPPYRYIRCEDGGYQVWGKRKNLGKIRFEEKSEKEFIENNKFWDTPYMRARR